MEVNMKKLTALLLSVLIIICALPMGVMAEFTDITDTTTQENAAVLEMLGIVNGVGGGSFNPGGILNRAEFCKLAVCAMNKQGSANQYSSLTIFPDVKGSYWASGYINYCVKNTIILGTGDGTFAPSRSIKFSEAVTILMRVLGYSDTDFASQWPVGYLNQADSIGLTDGLALTANDTLTRAQAAQLFKNLMITLPKSGTSEYITTIYSKTASSVVIVSIDNSEITAYNSSTLTSYETNCDIPDSFLGKNCILVLNSSGDVTAAVPCESEYTVKSVSVVKAEYTYVSDEAEKKYYIDEDTVTYYDEALTTYAKTWVNLNPGTELLLFYNKSSECKLIIVNTTAAESSSAVVLSAVPASVSELASKFGLSGESYKIIKNGNAVSVSELAKNDTVTYHANSGTFFVSDFKLTGYLEAAYPNFDTPTTITIAGAEFTLLPQAKSELEDSSLDKKLTLFFTSDLKVAAVISAQKLSVENTGYIKSVSSDSESVTVVLPNGITLSGEPDVLGYNTSFIAQGQLVKVSSNASGSLLLEELRLVLPWAKLDVTNATLGKNQLSSDCTIYDTVNGKCAAEVELSDIALSEIDEENVLHAEYDSSGKVSLLVLNDVTGDCYDYGYLEFYSTSEDAGVFGTNVINTLGVENSSSSATMYTYDSAGAYMDGKAGGIAASGKYVQAHVLLSSVTADRAAFSTDYVTVGSITLPLADDLVVYIKDTDTWGGTLADARSYSDSLTVYYDRAPEKGGKARFIVAN